MYLAYLLDIVHPFHVSRFKAVAHRQDVVDVKIIISSSYFFMAKYQQTENPVNNDTKLPKQRKL
jgi:hypothetical protein